eukprot:g30408.t1
MQRSADQATFRLIQQWPWRDGLQVDSTFNLDDQPRPLPKPLALGPKDTWQHRWQRGLHCERHFPDQDDNGDCFAAIQSDRNLTQTRPVRHDIPLSEINSKRSTVLSSGRAFEFFVSPAALGKESLAKATRIFVRKPFKASWRAAAAQFFSGTDVEKNLETCIHWMRKAKESGADLIVMPENSNRDRTYFKDGKPSRDLCWEHGEHLDGPFLAGVRRACRELGIWASIGVDLRGRERPTVHIGIVLIRPDGEIEGDTRLQCTSTVRRKPYQVFDTELGRLGLLCCADGIVPEAARVLSLMGAQVLLNSLNSRGPDEMRVHIPLRAIENGVWHIASNTVGNPNTVGLLWPWTGGSEVCDPRGRRVVASEEQDDMVLAEVRPAEADLKESSWSQEGRNRPARLTGCPPQDVWASRRPDLYGLMTQSLEAVPAATMYGPAPEELPFKGPEILKCTEWMMQRQVSYASRRGAILGVMPSLWCFQRGEVAADVPKAAQYSAEVLEMVKKWAKDAGIYLCCSLVEEESGQPSTGSFFHTAYLIGPAGSILGKYRKTHLNKEEVTWASVGHQLCIIEEPALGRVAMMMADEVWSPELARCLALAGAEVVLHCADWDVSDAGEMAATERATENRFHLVSVNRLDSPGRLGSQTILAGEYIGGEPIPLMRYGQGIWCRYGVEEQIIVELQRRLTHCKMMGDHLDVLAKRSPELYHVCCTASEDGAAGAALGSRDVM